MQHIVVPEEALAALDTSPYDRVQGFIDHVNTMIQQCSCRLEELPDAALQVYWSDYYLAQVNNGGHSQFIRNSRLAKGTIEAIDQGLQAMGADACLKVFCNMLDWARDNPDEASAQTGFAGGRAEYLDTLDSEFYAIEKTTPMINLSARWLAGQDNLTAVP